MYIYIHNFTSRMCCRHVNPIMDQPGITGDLKQPCLPASAPRICFDPWPFSWEKTWDNPWKKWERLKLVHENLEKWGNTRQYGQKDLHLYMILSSWIHEGFSTADDCFWKQEGKTEHVFLTWKWDDSTKTYKQLHTCMYVYTLRH